MSRELITFLLILRRACLMVARAIEKTVGPSALMKDVLATDIMLSESEIDAIVNRVMERIGQDRESTHRAMTR